MGTVIFDVETVGANFDELDEFSKEYFLKFADSEEKVEEAKKSLNFYPLTAQIVAIAMLDADSDEGAVYYQEESKTEKFKEGNVIYVPATEKEILEHFWKQLRRYNQFVTFNGRAFDGPFIMIRSAIHHIRAEKNLIPYRYNYATHIDLADQMTFYDAFRRKFGLHMWCQAFGIKSPKEQGVTGLQVQDLFHTGKHLDIARYCMEDVRATKELYLYWDKYLKVV